MYFIKRILLIDLHMQQFLIILRGYVKSKQTSCQLT